MRAVGGALALAAVWLSPAALLGLGPLLLADGTRGLWPPVVLAGGALVVVLLLAGPWSRRAQSSPPTLVDLVERRWPSSRRSLAPLAATDVGTALLFLWAQLAAGRELGRTLGWSPWLTVGIGAILLALVASHDAMRLRAAGAGSVLGIIGLSLPLAVVLTATTPRWPQAWTEVASRPRATFSARGAWSTEGRSVRAAGSEQAMTFTEEQKVTLLGRGPVRVGDWTGRESRREVTSQTELTLRPGERLVVPDGFPLRFEPGRRIPGAPATGPDWVAPPGRRADWRALVGLGVTLLVGALGLSAVHAALPRGVSEGLRGAPAGAALAILGLGLATLWALYAAWLTPEVYVGGGAGPAVYELPATMGRLAGWGAPLRLLALIGLVGMGVAAALPAVRAVPHRSPPGGRRMGPATFGVIAASAILALVTPASAWPVLLAAFGLGASAGAPAAVMSCWGERATARGVLAGASLGLALFGGLSIVALARLGGPAGSDPAAIGSGLGWLVAWPAVVALPANALTVWLFPSRPGTSSRSRLLPGLAELHG